MAELDREKADDSEDVVQEVGEDVVKEEVDKLPMKTVETSEPTVPFLRLFSMADKYDYLLMFLGTIGAAGHGAALPLYIIFFGDLLSGVGASESDASGAFLDTVNKNVIYLLYLALGSWISSWLEVACWIQTGERQSARLRIEYLKSLLRHDVEYFDIGNNAGCFVNSIAADPPLVQDAISEKMGSFIHYLATFFAGLCVGFSHEWRLSLVTVAVLPLIATGVGINTWNLSAFSAKSAAAYSEAGSIAREIALDCRKNVNQTSDSIPYLNELPRQISWPR